MTAMEIPRFKAYTSANLKCHSFYHCSGGNWKYFWIRQDNHELVLLSSYSVCNFQAPYKLQPKSPSTAKIYQTDLNLCVSHRRGLRVTCKWKVTEARMFSMGQEQRLHLPEFPQHHRFPVSPAPPDTRHRPGTEATPRPYTQLNPILTITCHLQGTAEGKYKRRELKCNL